MDCSHDMPAFFTDNLAGQPTGTIAGAVSYLLVFLKLSLTFQPDRGIRPDINEIANPQLCWNADGKRN